MEKISNNRTALVLDLSSFLYSTLKRVSPHHFRISDSVVEPCPGLPCTDTIILQAVKYKLSSPPLMHIHEHTWCSSLIWYPPAQAVLHPLLQSRLMLEDKTKKEKTVLELKENWSMLWTHTEKQEEYIGIYCNLPVARTAEWSLLYVYFQCFMTLGRALIRIHRLFQPIKDSSNKVLGCGSRKQFPAGYPLCPRCFTCSTNISYKETLVFFSLFFLFF